MFKEENRIWLYFVGVLLMFGILALFTQDVMIPLTNDPVGTRVNISTLFSKPPANTLENLNYFAILQTNFGSITIDLFEDNAPLNVNNFVFLAREDFYDGTKFHRLIPGLLLQGGDRNTLDAYIGNDGLGGPRYVVEDELNVDSLSLSDDRKEELKDQGYSTSEDLRSANLVTYSVAMASSGPDTNGSQFFIVLANSTDQRLQLMNGKFTVIGQVVEGFETLQTIQSVQVDDQTANIPRPLQDIILTDVQIITQ